MRLLAKLQLTDYRYIGNAPYNYVTFNDELWRIIGVFTVDDGTGNTEQRIKIVRNENLSTNMAWNSANTNEWGTASLKKYLNGEYHNGLDKISQDMINETKFYLGAISGYDNLNGEDYYNYERSTNKFNERSINWIGKIALMYPSDYSYTYSLGIDNTCYNDGFDCGNSTEKINGWIYNTNSNNNQWVLSYRSGYGSDVFRIYSSGSIMLNSASNSYGIRPTLYLKPEVRIKSGNGSIDNPYEFEL